PLITGRWLLRPRLWPSSFSAFCHTLPAKETIHPMSTTTWPGASPRRADNVELAPRISEDWLSLIIGLSVFVLALAGIANIVLLGWVVTTSVWNDVWKGVGPVSQ